MRRPVPGRTKVLLGVIGPTVAFLVYDVFLIQSVSGKGDSLGFAAMALYFRSFIIVPLVFFANALLMMPDWKSKVAVVLGGAIAPSIAGAYAYGVLYGH